MSKLIALLLLFVAMPTWGQLSGRIVYQTGKPATQIRVSDGKQITTTDQQGHYTLKGHGGQKFIFLTTPSGFNTTKKHYLPIIEGQTNGYDFTLYPTTGKINKSGAHTFIQITDTEISGTEGHEKWVSGVRDYAADQGAAFIVHTGDICYEKGLKAHIELMNDQNMGVPVRYCVGNHDYVKGAYGEELFEQKYGPIYYSFDVGNTHYVVTPMPHGDYKPGFSKELFLEWLAADLAAMRPEQTLVVFNHDLVLRDGVFKWGAVDLLQHNLKAWIYGHWHINHVKNYGAVTTICSSADKGGIDHSVATFRHVAIDPKGTVSSKLIYPYVDRTMAATLCGTTLSVNSYNTASPVTGVMATYWDKGKMGTQKLTQATDWNFRGTIPATATQISVTAQCHNGQSLVERVNATPDTTFTLTWNTNTGSNIYMSSPIVVGQNIYIGLVDESLAGNAGVGCFDAQSGEKKWFYPTRNSIKNTIATGNGKIFAQDAEGYLYALCAEKGSLVWEQKLTVADPLPSVVEGLAVHQGRLYAGTGKGLTALDFDGKVLWRNTEWAQNEGTTSTFAFTDNLVLTGSQWQALFANDLATGKLIWRADRDGLRFRASTPLIAGGVAYVLSSTSLFLLDLATGKALFRKELPYDVQVTSQPLLTERAIIFGTTNAGIQALDRHTFEPLWSVATEPGLIYTSPYQRYPAHNIESSAILTSKGNALIGSADGIVRLIDPTSGKVLHQTPLGAPILGTFAVQGTACYVADYAGNLYRFDTAR